jgi:hypothetical protein
MLRKGHSKSYANYVVSNYTNLQIAGEYGKLVIAVRSDRIYWGKI